MTYEGRLSDGTVFDRCEKSVAACWAGVSPTARNSCDDGTTFTFEVGKGKVIRGWDVGVATMRVGERAELVCRSDAAYGAAGSPPDIPPDATLTFVVELLQVKPPRAAGAKVDAAAELARLSLQREARAAAVAATAEERKTSAQKREEAKAAAAARLANKGQKKGGKK